MRKAIRSFVFAGLAAASLSAFAQQAGALRVDFLGPGGHSSGNYGRTSALHANLVAYGVPIASASSSSPTYQVTCTMGWGTCPFSGRSMPIPTGATPSPGSDGALVVVDQASGTAGEYWRAAPGGNGWVAGWGAVNSLSGSGWGGASTGSGASRLAGVVRASEIQAGWIDHALVLQTDNVCRGTYRAPALKTDGDSTRSDCLPEGARLQLDPSIDVSSLPGITSAERTVARALQLYGGYVIDRGGSPLSVSFEKLPGSTTTSPGAAYVEAGLRWDYDGLPHVPWNRLRVLAG